jgi:hypothetical protein
VEVALNYARQQLRSFQQKFHKQEEQEYEAKIKSLEGD